MNFKRSRPIIGILPRNSVLAVNNLGHYRSTILKGIQSAARSRECNLLLGWSLMNQGTDQAVIKPAWPVVSPDSSFMPIGPWNTDGMIVFTPLQSEARSQYLQGLRQQGYPVLFINTGEDAPTISTKNETGIYQAVEHIAVFHGHHHIAFIAGQPNDQGDSAARLHAFQSAAVEYGLATDSRLIVAGMHHFSGGYQAVQTLLQSGIKFTAVIASNDASAIGAMQALRELGSLEIPRDVAIIGFDDQPDAIAQVPPLASIHVPLMEIGQQALILMSDHLNGRHALESIQLPTRLMPRHSCGCMSRIVLSAAQEKTRTKLADARLIVPEQDISKIQREIADDMISVLPHSLQYPYGEQSSRFCNSLIKAFYTSLKAEDLHRFQEKLIAILREVETFDEDVDVWQNTISILRREMFKLPIAWEEPQIQHFAEDLLHQARCTISESAQHRVYQNRYHQQIINQALGEITSALSAILDERGAVEILEANLNEVGIRHVRVALFEPEGDDPFAWSVILNARLGTASQRFPTRGFPPPGLYPADEILNVLILPLTFQDEALGYIAFDANNLEPCAIIAKQLASAFKTSRLHKQVIELSLQDSLSGIHNRRSFDIFLNTEVRRSIRIGSKIAIIMLDIDYFKIYNDTYGHPAGDKVIQNVALCMKEGRRSTDIAARIGGEEFALILPETDLKGAWIVAERIQGIIRTSPNFEHPITVSMGISLLSGADVKAETLLEEADLALYQAKQTGRDRICVFDRSAKDQKIEDNKDLQR